MFDFIIDCAGLFTDTFNAACSLDFFKFFSAVLVFDVSFGLFLLIFRGSKKL